jgi:hypothetical protein
MCGRPRAGRVLGDIGNAGRRYKCRTLLPLRCPFSIANHSFFLKSQSHTDSSMTSSFLLVLVSQSQKEIKECVPLSLLRSAYKMPSSRWICPLPRLSYLKQHCRWHTCSPPLATSVGIKLTPSPDYVLSCPTLNNIADITMCSLVLATSRSIKKQNALAACPCPALFRPVSLKLPPRCPMSLANRLGGMKRCVRRVHTKTNQTAIACFPVWRKARERNV